MATIDLSNYDSATLGLVQSTQSRTGTPDGNIFFDVANGRIELITVEELAVIDMSSRGGSGTAANPLSQQDGVKMEALYAFEREQRRLDETLRQYDYFFEGTFKFGGAYKLVNGRVFDDSDGTDTGLADNTAGNADDRVKVRGSGWNEEQSGGIARIYYGVGSLGNIETLSQPYYILGSDSPANFSKDGGINEAIQVLGNIALDANTTTFDKRTALSNRIRTFGFNYDEKVLADSGVTEMAGYFSGFALGESPHLTSGNYTLANVYTTQISPWTGMTLEKLAVPQTESGFNEADGDFTWVVNNTVPGTLDEVVAFLDALSQTEDDIDSGTETVTNGKIAGTWYSYNATGQIVTNAPFASEGLFLEQIPVSDQQRVVFTDDADALKTYPFNSGIQVTVGANAVADVLSWYHAFFLDGPAANDFNTANALTVLDNVAATVKGNVSTDFVNVDRIDFTFDYDGDTTGGTAGTDKDVVFECEGDGGVTAAKTVFTITRTATIAVTCQPGVETNV